MSDDQPILLADVAPERARRENDLIDEQFSDLEQQVASLEDEKADLESDLESVREEKQALEDVVATYKDQRKTDLIADIRETIEGAAVNEEDFDYDFDALEADADLETLQTVKQAVETTVEAAGLNANNTPPVDNRDRSPDLGDVNSGEDGEYEEAARKAADDLGMGEAWEKVQSGESLAERTGVQLGNDESSHDELVAALQEVTGE